MVRLTAEDVAAQIAGVQGLQNAFAVGLKNGYYNLIHSLSVEYNNTSIVQLTPYTNFYVTYKLMTSLSSEDVEKFGATIGFVPDSSDSFDYVGVGANPSGHGSINNTNAAALQSDALSWSSVKTATFNKGFKSRQVKCTAFTPGTQATSVSIQDGTAAGNVAHNYFANQAGNAGTALNSKVWYVMATIRLKDVADVFDKMPLVKGAYLRFIINTNTATHNLALTLDGTAVPARLVTDLSSTSNIIQGGTSPLIAASARGVNTAALTNGQILPNGGYGPATITVGTLAAATYNFTLQCSIGRDNTLNVQHPSFAQCRLYVPLYQLNPTFEEQYLSLNRTKKIVYRDIYQYNVPVSVANGTGTFNTLLTNGIPNPKAIIIVPMIQAASNPTSAGGLTCDPFQSPFAAEPSTTAPLVTFRNFNIQVAGQNIFIQNEDYNFECFQNNLASMNAINGGLVDGLTSGLIGFDEFQSNYCYFVADLSRRLPAEDAVPKSVQILGTVQSQVPVQLFVFIEHEKSFSIDLQTGQKIE